MNKTTTTSNQWSHKPFLDDSTSQTSSSFSCRISRRQDENYRLKKSSSKRLSQSPESSVGLSQFYVKIGGNALLKDPKVQNKQIISNGINLSPRRREGTPDPVNRFLRSQAESVREKARDQALCNIQNDVLIAELQKKLNQEREKKQIFEKRACTFQRELKQKLKKIQEAQGLLAESKKRQEELRNKLKQIEGLAIQKEDSLTQVRSNLQKLKKSIKENRSIQLQGINERLRGDKQSLTKRIALLEQENAKLEEEKMKLDMQCKQLRKRGDGIFLRHSLMQKDNQIARLRSQIKKSKSQREILLEKFISQKEEEVFQKKIQVQKMQIKVNYLNRKKIDEFQAYKEKKNGEIANLRAKIAKLSKILNDLRNEGDRLRCKNSLHMSMQIERKGIMGCDRSMRMGHSDDVFSLELSPQQFQL